MESNGISSRVARVLEVLLRKIVKHRYQNINNINVVQYLDVGISKLPQLFGVAEIDEERIIDYLVYQIYRSRKAILDGMWSHTWLFSPNALDKYKKQFMSADGKSGINYYINQWLDDIGLTRAELTAMIAKPKPNMVKKMVYLSSEDPIKRRFLNTPEGLALCQQATTGWSPQSPICGQCDNWEECGKITAKKYPELMRYRKEVWQVERKKMC